MMRARKPAAVPTVLAALAVLVVALAGPAPAARAGVNGVGLIDFSKKNFKVGDWVRYRIDVASSRGVEDTQLQQVSVVAEETYRGERCFWLETWVGPDSLQAPIDLALVSYAVFKDKVPDLNYRNYVRLVLLGIDEEGKPEMNELQRTNPNAPMPDLTPLRGKIDSLGMEKVEIEGKPIEARLVRLTRRLSNPRPMADSTINRIARMKRDSWISRKIPVTSLVKEDEFTENLLQSYKLGTPSTDAPEVLSNTLSRRATVVKWGTGARSDILDQWHREKGIIRAPGDSPGGSPIGDAPPN